MNKIAIAVTLASALALSACKKEAPEELPPPPQVDTGTPTPTIEAVYAATSLLGQTLASQKARLEVQPLA